MGHLQARGSPDPLRLGEADQEIHVLGSRLLLDDVLEQEVARVRVRALAVHGGAPPRELRHVLVVLRRPRAELGARQLALHPLLGERVQPAVPGIDGGLELLTERARRGHGRLLFMAATDRKSTRLNSSHLVISYAVFCLKKKKKAQES